MNRYWLLCLFGSFLVGGCTTDSSSDGTADVDVGDGPDVNIDLSISLPNNFPFLDDHGLSASYSTQGKVDLNGDFFKSFGINGRTCGSCHKPSDSWTVSLVDINLTFDLTLGLDPIFRPVDGTTSPNADVHTLADRRKAYSMLLSRGTIRIGIGMPTGADYTLSAVDDPYNFASASELSLFRRPLPATNLAFVNTVMWDGRVTGDNIFDAFVNQANAATEGHAQSPVPLPTAAANQIVEFETALSTAQTLTLPEGVLNTQGATGDPEDLSKQAVGAGAFDLFDSWEDSSDPAKRSVYRGQVVFNTQLRTTGGGACNGCHSNQNDGTNAKGTFFNIHSADGALRTADLPLYTFEDGSGDVVQTTDPGRGLITGLFADIGKFKVPGLRGLSARAPYFHNGQARTLLDVVRFYEDNLDFAFTEQQETDLVNFLAAL